MKRTAAIAVAVLLPAGGAGAAPLPTDMSASVSPQTLNWPSQTEWTYTVDMTAGPQGARFFLTFGQPGSWPSFNSGPAPVGAPVVVGQPTLTGNGSINPFPIFGPPSFGPLPPRCIRTTPLEKTRGFNGGEVELQPNVSATVTVPVTLAGVPWERVSYGLAFMADNDVFARPFTSVSGPKGVEIDVTYTGKGAKKLEFRRRSPVIRGTTEPSLNRQKLHFRAVPFTRDLGEADFYAAGSKSLGAARTRPGGSFKVDSRRLPKGAYTVMARYDNVAAGLVPDWNCGQAFTVVGRGH